MTSGSSAWSCRPSRTSWTWAWLGWLQTMWYVGFLGAVVVAYGLDQAPAELGVPAPAMTWGG